jgi:signal transduction histidine kinase
MKKVLLVFLVILIAVPTIFGAEITESQVKGMVAKAVKALKDNGEAALKQIGTTDGDFHEGELFAYVYDANVVLVAHPVKPNLVGRKYKGKPDIVGVRFRDMIVANGLNGGGWTRYTYQSHTNPEIIKKQVWSEAVDVNGKKYIVACGMTAKK